ncbi:MAG: penicillin-binding protein activator, partial [Gammaproteobacteria bacterium]|nr:penicillin-binding protein activator [Gammaproteobacteria bacterium]
MKRAAIISILSLGLLYLGGCGQAPKKDVPQVQPPAASLPKPPGTETSEAEKRGDHLAAAREYSQRAAQSSADEKHFYQLRMAENLLLGGYLEPARQALQEMQSKQLNPDHRSSRQILLARIARQDRQPRVMLDYLSITPDTSVSVPLRKQYFELRASAYQMLGNHFEYARERIRLEPYLAKDEIEANHESIWNALSLINTQLLYQFRSQPPPNQLSGWLELAHLSKAYLNRPQLMKQKLKEWRR